MPSPIEVCNEITESMQQFYGKHTGYPDFETVEDHRDLPLILATFPDGDNYRIRVEPCLLYTSDAADE